MDSISLEQGLTVAIAILGALSAAIVSVRYRKIVVEFKELAEALKEALEDKKLTKAEIKELISEIVDVIDAIRESAWSLKK
jgi:flagellar motor component MotA